jgi:hypothetical protein
MLKGTFSLNQLIAIQSEDWIILESLFLIHEICIIQKKELDLTQQPRQKCKGNLNALQVLNFIRDELLEIQQDLKEDYPIEMIF